MLFKTHIINFLRTKEGKKLWRNFFENDPCPMYSQKLLDSEIIYMVHHLDNWIIQSKKMDEAIYYMYNKMDTL